MGFQFGFVEQPALLALCDETLWTNGAFHAGGPSTLRCSGRQILKGQEPSGSNPTTIGLCTCRCHADHAVQERDGNAKVWEEWKRKRAPLQVRTFELDRQEGRAKHHA
jgi:hypothetical protein